MDELLFYHLCLSLLFLGVSVLFGTLPLFSPYASATSNNKRGIMYYSSGGGLLALSMGFFQQLQPAGLHIPIPFASNVVAVLGFLLILTLTTIFVFEDTSSEYAPVGVEDGSEFEMSGDMELPSSSTGACEQEEPKPLQKQRRDDIRPFNALSETYSEKTIISFCSLSVMMFLNFLLGFWLSSKEHTGYKDFFVTLANHCLLSVALSSIIISHSHPLLPRFFWYYVLSLSVSAPIGIMVGNSWNNVNDAAVDGSFILQDPSISSHMKIIIHLGLSFCRGVLMYIATVCMMSHAIVNKNSNRPQNVIAVVFGSICISLLNEI